MTLDRLSRREFWKLKRHHHYMRDDALDGWAPDGHRWVAGEPRKNGYDRWDYRDDGPELFYFGSGDQLLPEFLMFQSGSQLSPHISPKTKETRSFVFVIDFSGPRGLEPASTGGKGSIVVRIEAEDVLFTLGATEPKRATTAFAKALAQQTALLAIEKYFPNGVEPSLCTRQIDHLPIEFENRLPDLCVNGNTAWLP